MGEVKWMQERKYGIMVHYLSHIMPREGEKTRSWDEMADAFPLQEFCDEIQAAGAGWVIFPIGQNTGYYCSPNEVMDQYWPGHCSKRDLMMELAEELNRRDIKLIAYLPSEMYAAPEEEREAFGWDLDPRDKSVFMSRYTEVLRCWAEKLGTLLHGWWFDGCYNSYEKSFTRTHRWDNTRFDYAEWKSAVCAGNPDAVVAMNPGAEAFWYVFDEQDYLGGEANTLNHHNDGPLIFGMQWHCLIWLDCFWMHSKAGEIEPPRFSDEEVVNFALECAKQRGAVTWNVGIYEDGTMAEQTLAQIHKVKEALEKDEKDSITQI